MTRSQEPRSEPTTTTPGGRGAAVHLTVANGLTLLRLLIVAPSACAIVTSHWGWAAALFTIAAISDFYDGRLARRYHQTSTFGGVFDHGTDALYVTCCLAAAAYNGQITPLLPTLIPLAFTQYLLDSRVLAGRPLRGNWLGRINGVAYFVLAGACIGQPLLLKLGVPLPAVLVSLAAQALSLSTLLSMLLRGAYWWRLSRPGRKPHP